MESALDFKAKGNEEFKKQNYEQAIEFYSKAIEMDPEQVSFYSNRAGAYLNIGQFEKALGDGEKCVEIDPQFAKGYSRKGFALIKMGKFEEAVTLFDEGLKLFPENKDFIEKKAQAEEGKNAKSNFNIQELMNNPSVQSFMKNNPQMASQLMNNPELLKNPQMMQNLMNMFGKNGKFGVNKQGQQQQGEQQQQQQQPGQQQQFNPNEPNQQQQQQQTTTQPQQTKPDPVPEQKESNEFNKQKEQGNRLYLSKKFDEAIEIYDKCIELDNLDLLVRNNKAACYIQKKDYELAQKTIDEAIKIYKEKDFKLRSFVNFAKVLARKARICHLQGNYDDAIQYYTDSLLEDRVNKVSAKLRELKREKTKKEQQEYINPQLSEEHRQKGNEFFKKSQFAEAIKEYEEANKRNPKDAKVYNNMAACFMKVMKYDSAKQQIEKCLNLEPENIKAMIRLSTIHYQLKEYHKAIKQYQKILKIEPDNQQAQQGLQQTQIKINSSMGSEHDEERVKRAMTDPEIQAIMMDPMVRIALEQMKTNPKKAMEYMQDPTLAPKIQKLIQAGILRMG